MTAAFELTATPELRERFEVTVYQLGWRLGGKGASGRNLDSGERIEEHGLHVWFGFYDNAFRPDARRLRGARPADRRAAGDLEDAFKPCDELVLYDRQGDGWHAARASTCRRNSLRPGDAGGCRPSGRSPPRPARWALGRLARARRRSHRAEGRRAAAPTSPRPGSRTLRGRSPPTCCALELARSRAPARARPPAGQRPRAATDPPRRAGRPPVVPGQAC